ncbi:MAG: peptidoglycan editing factor PgeF [Holosporales bacterium]|jgi:YfiH family protein|nr:peptidoglycan editing factor PgeF [Holosporales bacterium]
MEVIKSDLFSEIDFINHGFFNRHGGKSCGDFGSLNVGLNRGDNAQTVLINREIIAKHFDCNISGLVMLNQGHGNYVHLIDEKTDLSITQTGDSIITNQPRILIGVGTADCAPILLCDKETRFIGAIHAGWRGVIAGVIENTIKKLQSLGCSNITAAIGPCLQKQSFKVDPEIITQVHKTYLFESDDQIYFDLPLLINDKLSELGVNKVSMINIDTFSNNDFFSYRRQSGHCGVQFSGLYLKNK